MKTPLVIISCVALTSLFTSCVPLALGAVGGFILRDQTMKTQSSPDAMPAQETQYPSAVYEEVDPYQQQPQQQAYPSYEPQDTYSEEPFYQNY